MTSKPIGYDAAIIAEVASGLPRLVKGIDKKTPERHSLSVIMSHDRELTAEVTRSANMLHSLLLAVCPVLEEAMAGKKIQNALSLLLLERYGGPCGLKSAGCGRVKRFVKSRRGFGEAAAARVDDIFDAMRSRTLVLPGSHDLEDLIKMEAQARAGLVSHPKHAGRFNPKKN